MWRRGLCLVCHFCGCGGCVKAVQLWPAAAAQQASLHACTVPPSQQYACTKGPCTQTCPAAIDVYGYSLYDTRTHFHALWPLLFDVFGTCQGLGRLFLPAYWPACRLRFHNHFFAAAAGQWALRCTDCTVSCGSFLCFSGGILGVCWAVVPCVLVWPGVLHGTAVSFLFHRSTCCAALCVVDPACRAVCWAVRGQVVPVCTQCAWIY